MPYKSVATGRVFILKWLTTPQSGDLGALGQDLTEHHRRARERLINLSIIPAEISPPNSAVRAEMETFNRIWSETCSSVHVVVGGSGFKNAVIRSIVSAFALLGRERGLVRVHRSLDDAIAEIYKIDDRVTPESLRGALKRSGFLDDHP